MNWPFYSPIAEHVTSTTWPGTGLRLTVPNNANGMLIQALTQNIRIKIVPPNAASNPAIPNASSGFQIKAGDPPRFLPIPPAATVIFQQEAATAQLEYQFVRATELK